MISKAERITKMVMQTRRILRGQENVAARNVVGIYRAAQDEIEAAIQAAFRRAGITEWNLATMKVAEQDIALFRAIDQALIRMTPQVEAQIAEGFQSQFIQGLLRTSYSLDQLTPVTLRARVPIIPANAIRAMANLEYSGAMFSQRIGAITDQIALQIRDELITSMIRGESMAKAGARVADVIGAGNLADPESFAARAETIARTEIMRAQNLGYETAYKENADILDGWEWLVTPDDRLCPECLEMEGKTDKEAKEPPPLHPNCRCTMVPRLKSWKELGLEGMPDDQAASERGMRDSRSGEWIVMPAETFDEWAAQRGLAA